MTVIVVAALVVIAALIGFGIWATARGEKAVGEQNDAAIRALQHELVEARERCQRLEALITYLKREISNLEAALDAQSTDPTVLRDSLRRMLQEAADPAAKPRS